MLNRLHVVDPLHRQRVTNALFVEQCGCDRRGSVDGRRALLCQFRLHRRGQEELQHSKGDERCDRPTSNDKARFRMLCAKHRGRFAAQEIERPEDECPGGRRELSPPLAVREGDSELLSGPEKECLHCGTGNGQLGGNLVVCEAVPVAHDQGLTLSRGQAPEGFGEPEQLFPRRPLGGGNLVERVGIAQLQPRTP
jgi:hypothetical protein